MAHLYDYKVEDYKKLLASDKVDASKGVLFQTTGLEPDTFNRTIIIGLGGTGVKTADYIKGVISKTLAPTWTQYIAFLGIDSDRNEIDHASYLTQSEFINITLPGVGTRMARPETYPAAVKRFMPEGAVLGNLDSDGCGRTRLAGKVKIHDQQPGTLGNDETVVNKIAGIKANKFAPMSGTAMKDAGNYAVYVVGSVCGGTCSGAIIEMPALIRKALPNNVKIHLLAFLPDTLESLDPTNKAQLQANGYATLKELNYYVGMAMRPNNAETWAYNSAAKPEISFTSTVGTEKYIDVPYLVGTLSGGTHSTFAEAQESVAQFLISILAKIKVQNGQPFLTSSFESNARALAKISQRIYSPGSTEYEAEGEYHDFPKRYAAIGYAKASFPKKTARAYAIGKLCDLSGIIPVSASERTGILAAGDEGRILPFRAKDDLMNAQEGTAAAKKILEPIANILNIVHSAEFNISQVYSVEVTFDDIRDGALDRQNIVNMTNTVVQNATDNTKMNALRDRIIEAFNKYRINVQSFVKEEGPHAFANLYEGRFSPVGTDYGVGIGVMLSRLVLGNKLDDKRHGYLSEEAARANLAAVRAEIVNCRPGLIARAGGKMGIHTKMSDFAAQWVAGYEALQKARITERRRNAALGANGYISNYFVRPAALLKDEIASFGYVLDALSDTYSVLGSPMESFESFMGAKESSSGVNIAAINVNSYAWLKHEADATLANVNARKFRDELIDEFFAVKDGVANCDEWLNIPDGYVENTANGLALTVADRAVPVRFFIDQYIGTKFADELRVGIVEMFNDLIGKGMTRSQIANEIISRLAAVSKPRINGDLSSIDKNFYIMYPASLDSEDPDIVRELISAANTICGEGINVFGTASEDGISFYQMAAPFEIYRISALKNWEDEYEQGDFGIRNVSTYLHGKSPDLDITVEPGKAAVFTQKTEWKDYPPITGSADHRMPNPVTGEISREGQIQKNLDELISKARKMGVLYSEQIRGGGYIIKRLFCDKSRAWSFDLSACVPNELGLLPEGKDFADTFAQQNGTTRAAISATVALETAGVLNMPHSTEELAWKYAARVLRAHMPMYAEVRDTVSRFEPELSKIVEFNDRNREKFNPAKFAWLVKSGIVRKNQNDIWEYLSDNGKVTIKNLNPQMRTFLGGADKLLLEYSMLAYLVYSNTCEVIRKNRDSFDAAKLRGEANIAKLMENEDYDTLTSNEELFQSLFAERAKIEENGAKFDFNTDSVKAQFKKAYPRLTDDKLIDIDKFYYAFGLFDQI